MSPKSNERRSAVSALRKKANFLLKQEKNQLIPVRSNNRNSLETVTEKSYVPCVHCLGYFKTTYLWRHNKICKSKMSKEPNKNSTKIEHLTESQTFMVSPGLLGNYRNKSRLKNEVFNIMRPHEISLAAKSDALIVVVSNKLREMGNLQAYSI